jgi:hypothetical protein
MPIVVVPANELLPFGQQWNQRNGRLSRTRPYSSLQLGELFDAKIGAAVAAMLGNIPVIKPKATDLLPRPEAADTIDCVEVGHVRIVGGVRPQNFDVGYRPDGVRFAFDSKTLNDTKSVKKNYQNMINDLATEATTVHTRFPYAVVGFLLAIPTPCLVDPQKDALTLTLERLTGRSSPLDSLHKAEAIALVVWNPETGAVENNWPKAGSLLRLENFSQQIEKAYVDRYKGLPPHKPDDDEDVVEAEAVAEEVADAGLPPEEGEAGQHPPDAR